MTSLEQCDVPSNLKKIKNMYYTWFFTTYLIQKYLFWKSRNPCIYFHENISKKHWSVMHWLEQSSLIIICHMLLNNDSSLYGKSVRSVCSQPSPNTNSPCMKSMTTKTGKYSLICHTWPWFTITWSELCG